MKLPYPKWADVIPIVVKMTDGITENGEDNVVLTYTGKCNLSEGVKTIRDADGKLIQLEAKLSIGCDIGPNLKTISGVATLNGKDYKIYRSRRPRNPDGSVHHTELELI